MTYEEALKKALAIKQGGRDTGGSSYDSCKRSCSDVAHGGHQGYNNGGSIGDDDHGHKGQQEPL